VRETPSGPLRAAPGGPTAERCVRRRRELPLRGLSIPFAGLGCSRSQAREGSYDDRRRVENPVHVSPLSSGTGRNVVRQFPRLPGHGRGLHFGHAPPDRQRHDHQRAPAPRLLVDPRGLRGFPVAARSQIVPNPSSGATLIRGRLRAADHQHLRDQCPSPSQLGFIVYCVNKYLLYNEPTRIMLEQLIRMSRQFEPMDYLITYFLFCKSHKCYFPKWMPFYYTNMNPFKSFVMENAKLTEEEFKIFCKRHEDKTMRDLAYLIKEIY